MNRIAYTILIGALLGCSVDAAEPVEGLGTTSQALSSAHAGREHKQRKLQQCLDVLTADSCCGFPGDRGNELGVGQFCVNDDYCARNDGARTCSSAENGLTDHESFFCTMPCDPGAEGNTCGEGAACECEEEIGCGCTPIACSENPPEGCEEP